MSKIVKKTEIELKNIIEQAVKKAVSNGALPEAEMPQFNIEKPANKDNGDYSTNVAMAGARAFKKAPRMIAEAIVSCIDLDGTAFERVEIAGPGFMNFFLSQQFYSNVLKDVFSCGKDYGKSDVYRAQEDERMGQIQRLRTEKNQIFQPVKKDTDNLQAVMDTVGEAGDVMHLSQNVVETFIDRIEVFNNERVKIHFTFEDTLNSYEEK